MGHRVPISPKQRFRILQRDSFRCQYCGRDATEAKLEIDHIVPVFEGGGNQDSNLVTACKECNIGKGKISLETSYINIAHEIKSATDETRKITRFESDRDIACEISCAFDELWGDEDGKYISKTFPMFMRMVNKYPISIIFQVLYQYIHKWERLPAIQAVFKIDTLCKELWRE